MDTMASLTQWLRELIAAQAWLTWAQPYVARAPDWALLVAPALVVVLVAWALFRPRRKSSAKPDARLSRGSAVSAKPALRPPATPKSTPIAPPPKLAAAPPGARASGIPADSDDNRAVRVFISSTFIDMEGERNVLVKQTFPALRTKFRARGVEFLEIDLRWGVTEEEVQSGKTLPICLAEVDRCRPYFVGLLGERYGSLLSQDNLTPELQEAFPVLREGVGRSLTEIEIMQGVLRNRESASRALFFQRDPAWLKSLSAQERAQYETGDEADRAKLADLKARIRASGARIIEYARPEDIGPAVEAALSELIEARFPDAEAPDTFTQTLRLHGAYARERRGLHIGAAPYLAALDQWMAKGDAPPMLITGASGGGKSTVVANWLHAWRTAHPNDIVFEHYLGASPDSADPTLLMRRLWEHLNRATGESVELPAGNAELMDVASSLAQRLAQANAFAERNGANVLIVLDGLDKLSSEQNLRWLMNVPRVKLLASSLDGEAKSAALARGWTPLEVKPLSDVERRDFIEGTLKGWGRKLLPEQIAAILAHVQGGNPLFLKTVLDELRVSATHARLAERLGIYLGARDMPDLFARMLERLEADCEPGLVAKALPLIWASRSGLEEVEIIAIIGDKQRLAWATLRNGLGGSLRDQAGRVAFSHDFLRQAAETRYLATDDKKRAAHLAIADQVERREPDERQAEELPYQLEKAEAWDRLEALLVDLNRFELLRTRGDSELLGYWLPLQERGRSIDELLCGRFEARASLPATWAPDQVGLALALQGFLEFTGCSSEAMLQLSEGLTEAFASQLGADHPLTVTGRSNCAIVLRGRGDFQHAREEFEKISRYYSSMFGEEHQLTLSSQSHLAATLMVMGDFAEAKRLLQSVLQVHARTLGLEHPDTLKTMNNIAIVLRTTGDFNGALDLQQRVLESRCRVLGPEHRETIAVIDELAMTALALGDPQRAQELQEQSLEIRTRTLGPRHADTVNGMNNLAETLRYREHFGDALKRFKEVLEAQAQRLGSEHPLTLASLNNVAATLSSLKDHAGARAILEQLVATSTGVRGPDSIDTLTAENNLARAMRGCGDLSAAASLHESVLERARATLGGEHQITVGSQSNLATAFYEAGNFARARDLRDTVLASRLRNLGAEHPDTLEAMNDLAHALEAAGDRAGAQRHFEVLVNSCEHLPETRQTEKLLHLQRLAVIKLASGMIANRDFSRAEALFERALNLGSRLYGAADPLRRELTGFIDKTRAARRG